MKSSLIPGAVLLLAAWMVVVAGCTPPDRDQTSSDSNAADGSGAVQGDGGPAKFEEIPAVAGVGKQGQKIAGRQGPLVTPISVLFEAKQRVVFEMAIPHALQLYQAEHGHFPKTQDEFMEKIVKFNAIELPELPEGHEYVYDPAEGKLMVRRPVE
jgi:hypothetical protein